MQPPPALDTQQQTSLGTPRLCVSWQTGIEAATNQTPVWKYAVSSIVKTRLSWICLSLSGIGRLHSNVEGWHATPLHSRAQHPLTVLQQCHMQHNMPGTLKKQQPTAHSLAHDWCTCMRCLQGFLQCGQLVNWPRPCSCSAHSAHSTRWRQGISSTLRRRCAHTRHSFGPLPPPA